MNDKLTVTEGKGFRKQLFFIAIGSSYIFLSLLFPWLVNIFNSSSNIKISFSIKEVTETFISTVMMAVAIQTYIAQKRQEEAAKESQKSIEESRNALSQAAKAVSVKAGYEQFFREMDDCAKILSDKMLPYMDSQGEIVDSFAIKITIASNFSIARKYFFGLSKALLNMLSLEKSLDSIAYADHELNILRSAFLKEISPSVDIIVKIHEILKRSKTLNREHVKEMMDIIEEILEQHDKILDYSK